MPATPLLIPPSSLGIMHLAAHLVFLRRIIQWHDGVGPVGMGNGTDQTHSFLVLIAEQAERLMVLGAEALIPDFPLDSLQLLGNLNHAAQLPVGPEAAVSGCLPTDRTRKIPLQVLPPARDASFAEIVATLNDDRLLQVFQAHRAAGLHL